MTSLPRQRHPDRSHRVRLALPGEADEVTPPGHRLRDELHALIARYSIEPISN